MHNLDRPFCGICDNPVWALHVGNIEIALNLWHGMTSATRGQIADEMAVTLQSMSNIYQWCNRTTRRTFDIDKSPREMKVQAEDIRHVLLNLCFVGGSFRKKKKKELSGSKSNILNVYFRGTGFEIPFVNFSHRIKFQWGHTHFIPNFPKSLLTIIFPKILKL